jgi:hypothetical protein
MLASNIKSHYLDKDQALKVINLVFENTKPRFINSFREKLLNHLFPDRVCETSINLTTNDTSFLDDEQALEIIQIVFSVTDTTAYVSLYSSILIMFNTLYTETTQNELMNIPRERILPVETTQNEIINMPEERTLLVERKKMSPKEPLWCTILHILVMIFALSAIIFAIVFTNK